MVTILSDHRRPSTLLACLCTIVAIVAAPAARAAEKGLQTDLSWGAPASDEPRTMEALHRTGVQWIRLDISWRNTETSPGNYDAANLALTDHAMDLAEQTGAKIIMAVSESPAWASGSTTINTPPRDYADFANFVGNMAARYKGRIAAWEIWNEPNHPRFWNPSPDAGRYARLLKAAAPAVRAADPSAKVVFGGLAHNDYPYLEQVYAAEPDIGDFFDVMATHPYTKSGQSPAIVDRRLDGRMTTTSFLAFEEVRDVMQTHGDDQPIWLTELGWSTNSQVLHPLGGVSEAVQARYLGLAFRLLAAAPDVEVAIVYNLRNNYWAHDADTWEDRLGLLRTDFSRKPAYHVFARINPSRNACPWRARSPQSPGDAAGATRRKTLIALEERANTGSSAGGHAHAQPRTERAVRCDGRAASASGSDARIDRRRTLPSER